MVNRAVNDGARVVNLSICRPKIPSRNRTGAILGNAAQRVLGVEQVNSSTFNVIMEEYRRLKRISNEAIISLAELARVLEKAEKQGVTIVAATGYPETDPKNTFEPYGSVMMVASINEKFGGGTIPNGGRVDIYAPGDGVAIPKNENSTGKCNDSNSFAASFVSAACAVASGKLGLASEIRQAVLDSANVVNRRRVVNFGNLVNRLYPQ